MGLTLLSILTNELIENRTTHNAQHFKTRIKILLGKIDLLYTNQIKNFLKYFLHFNPRKRLTTRELLIKIREVLVSKEDFSGLAFAQEIITSLNKPTNHRSKYKQHTFEM